MTPGAGPPVNDVIYNMVQVFFFFITLKPRVE